MSDDFPAIVLRSHQISSIFARYNSQVQVDGSFINKLQLQKLQAEFGLPWYQEKLLVQVAIGVYEPKKNNINVLFVVYLY